MRLYIPRSCIGLLLAYVVGALVWGVLIGVGFYIWEVTQR